MKRGALLAAANGAACGLLAITAYLVLERSITMHVPVALCLLQLLQWDASNALGPPAFSGGWPIAGLGLAMDVVVAAVWTAIFVGGWYAMRSVRERTLAWGLLFGAIVMVVMRYAVVPLGHAGRGPDTASAFVNVLIAHTLFFGLPVAIAVRKTLAR